MEDYIGLKEFNHTLDTEEDIIECAIQLNRENKDEFSRATKQDTQPKQRNRMVG